MPVGLPSSCGGTRRSISAALREQQMFRAKAKTSAASSMSSVPPVARRNSSEPSGRTASSRSVASMVTAVTGDIVVENRNRPTGSSIASRDSDHAFV